MINTFEFLINTAVESLEMVADAEKKAGICAQLAQAIALSGALRPEVEAMEMPQKEETKETTKEEKKSSKKKSSKKDALKPENTKAPAKAEETTEEAAEEEVPQVPEEPVAETPEVPEEPVQTPAQEVEMTDEWTDEMATAKAEQLELLNAYVEAWGEEFVYGDCLSAFSEGALVGGENVRPSNIDGFVIYLHELAQQNAE